MDKRLLDPKFNPRAGNASDDNAACEETLFDRYAAAALTGFLSAPPAHGLWEPRARATEAVEQAIAMLEERARLFGVTVEEKT